MASTLKEHLTENGPGEFRPSPHYFASGDYLTYFVSDERCYAKRVDDVLTVYLANGTERLVGCKVKGVRHILKKAGAFRVRVDGDGVRLGLFFFAGWQPARKEGEVLTKWYDLLEPYADVTISEKELPLPV